MRTGNIEGIQSERRHETGSILSPLLIISGVEVIGRNTSTRGILHKLLYADDLAVVADSETYLQERSVEWKETFGRHGVGVREETELTTQLCRKKEEDKSRNGNG